MARISIAQGTLVACLAPLSSIFPPHTLLIGAGRDSITAVQESNGGCPALEQPGVPAVRQRLALVIGGIPMAHPSRKKQICGESLP
jgi:hypothetical protein